MKNKQGLVFASVVAGCVIASAIALHMHTAGVRAARLQHVVAPAPYFPEGSVWTRDISKAPLSPQSSTMIDWLASAGGWGLGRMQADFSLRVLQADKSTARVPFRKAAQFYEADSDVVPTIPLPVGGGLENSAGYVCDITQADCHLSIADRPEGKLYESWHATMADGAMTAESLAVWDLDRVYPLSGRGDQCGSSDAAGFPVAPLLFTADEIAAGSINHAIRFILPPERMRAHFYVHPASHAGAPKGPPNAPPFGSLFRLKASYDLSKLSPPAQVVARAMQKYGMFLSDDGRITLTGQNDIDTTAKYADVGFNSHSMQPLKVTDFEVVDGGALIPITDNCVRNP